MDAGDASPRKMRGWMKAGLWVLVALVLLVGMLLAVDALVPDGPTSNFVYDGF